MQNEKLISIFVELYHLNEVLNEKFKVKAYKKVIDILKKFPDKITNIDQLKGIDGIGDKTLVKIEEILKTGKLKALDDLKKDPKIMARLELQSILGVGPVFAKKLVDKYHITTVKQFKSEYQSKGIELSHMQEIGIKYYDQLKKPITRDEYTKYLKVFTKKFHAKYKDLEIHVAGSYLKNVPKMKDIDIIIVYNKKIENWNEIIEYLVESGLIIEVINHGSNSLMAITCNYHHIDIKYCPKHLLPFYMLYFGSGEIFSRHIRQIAKEQGYKLSEAGLIRKDGRNSGAKTEKDVFDILGITYLAAKNR